MIRLKPDVLSIIFSAVILYGHQFYSLVPHYAFETLLFMGKLKYKCFQINLPTIY